MAARLLLEVVTPSRLVLSQMVEEVTAPGVRGEFGVLPGHTPFFTVLDAGQLSFRSENKIQRLAVSQGFVEVLPDRVSVLAEAAEFSYEIDLDRAERAKARAEERLKKLGDDEEGFYAATAALKRALTRIQVAGR